MATTMPAGGALAEGAEVGRTGGVGEEPGWGVAEWEAAGRGVPSGPGEDLDGVRAPVDGDVELHRRSPSLPDFCHGLTIWVAAVVAAGGLRAAAWGAGGGGGGGRGAG